MSALRGSGDAGGEGRHDGKEVIGMVVSVPRERRPVTVVTEEGTDMPYVVMDSYGDKRERYATLEEAKAAVKEINES